MDQTTSEVGLLCQYREPLSHWTAEMILASWLPGPRPHCGNVLIVIVSNKSKTQKNSVGSPWADRAVVNSHRQPVWGNRGLLFCG